MTKNQNEEFVQHYCSLVEDYLTNISKKVVKIPAMNAIKVNFHFSNYKSKEILSCHSNQCVLAMAIKKQWFYKG